MNMSHNKLSQIKVENAKVHRTKHNQKILKQNTNDHSEIQKLTFFGGLFYHKRDSKKVERAASRWIPECLTFNDNIEVVDWEGAYIFSKKALLLKKVFFASNNQDMNILQ